MAAQTTLAQVQQAAVALGLALRGAFHCEPGDGVPAGRDGDGIKTLVLLGWIGGRQWPSFARSREAGDGAPHPLDRWSKRIVDALATDFDASPFYPFGGPPYLPFQRWAERGDDVFASPLGIYVHPDHGLWHSYRGALGFRERLELPERVARAHPCETCEAKPCLSACPVSAFNPGHYDVDRCAAHVKSVKGVTCFTGGCLARRACWVAPDLAYGVDEAGFYMRAFTAAH
ncbi:ferredoxin [Labrys okinawensis]|uniref:ferredoxin n=1 Tax=Labrys okinawensis TaxID=346911 RepID=UPI0039BCA33D